MTERDASIGSQKSEGVMSVQQQQSEVARIRQEIEAECVAMTQGLTGYGVVSRHAFVFARMLRLSSLEEKLRVYLSHEQALELLCETYNRVLDEKQKES